jgi:hypothetical protein
MVGLVEQAGADGIEFSAPERGEEVVLRDDAQPLATDEGHNTLSLAF